MPNLTVEQTDLDQLIRDGVPERKARSALKLAAHVFEQLDKFTKIFEAERLPAQRKLLQEQGMKGQALEDALIHYTDEVQSEFVKGYFPIIREDVLAQQEAKRQAKQARLDSILQGLNLFAPKQDAASTTELAKVSEEKTAVLKPSSGG